MIYVFSVRMCHSFVYIFRICFIRIEYPFIAGSSVNRIPIGETCDFVMNETLRFHWRFLSTTLFFAFLIWFFFFLSFLLNSFVAKVLITLPMNSLLWQFMFVIFIWIPYKNVKRKMCFFFCHILCAFWCQFFFNRFKHFSFFTTFYVYSYVE